MDSGSGAPFGAVGARVSVNALLYNQYHTRFLRHLGFYRAGLGDEGVDALVDILRPRDSMLKALEVVDCGITANGCTYLGIALKTNIGLLSLVLDHNEIGDEGVANLSRQGLMVNKTLQFLSLKYCGLGLGGARTLAAEIIPHCPMPSLVLAGNMLGNEGALALAGALSKKECQLKNLDLQNCFFGDDLAVLEEFRDLVAQNTTISKLNLTGNLFDDPAAGPMLLELMKTNTNLTTLGNLCGVASVRTDAATFKASIKQSLVNTKNEKKRAKKGKKGGKKKGGKKGGKK
jgi:Ran GTPase-activating protein (RanGAP) involved in mRNA processing and transport